MAGTLNFSTDVTLMLENLTQFEAPDTLHSASAVVVEGPVYVDIAENISAFAGPPRLRTPSARNAASAPTRRLF